ncbi:MAG: acetolactate synthase large subunit [Proteobacteria bacterium]|nr:acetolactate synthase large subunit [Pseudomonadota bacterium]
MNGAESLVHTLLRSGVDTCFANPGTSEMHFVAALDRIPGMRCVLGLAEGVVTGAADGYARMAGKPACTLLHCGPGLANGLANLHNARRAHTAVVNIVGDQATYHRPLDAPLTAETEGWARGVSAWTRSAVSAATVGSDAALAVQEASAYPGQIATLILPADTAWTEGGVIAEPLAPLPPSLAAPHVVEQIARLVRRGEPTLLLLGNNALGAEALDLANRIAQATGAALMAQGSNARMARGRGRVPVERVPYVVDQAVAALAPYRHVVLVGATAPVAFFAYPGKPGYLHSPDAHIHVLARAEQDAADALRRLADALGAPQAAAPDPGPRPEAARGAPGPEAVAQTLAATMPDDAVIVDEAVSFGRGFFPGTRAAPPHDWLQITGGAIGCGMPLATGAAVGAPGRRVVALQADGSAMYTLQALWTQAREKLDVTTILLSNRKYAILLGELANVGANPGRTALDMMDLSNPTLEWTRLAEGMGVEAARAEDCETLADLIGQASKRRGPFLIELMI